MKRWGQRAEARGTTEGVAKEGTGNKGVATLPPDPMVGGGCEVDSWSVMTEWKATKTEHNHQNSMLKGVFPRQKERCKYPGGRTTAHYPLAQTESGNTANVVRCVLGW